MKTSFPRALLVAAALILTVGAVPAAAWREPSVFPRPVDPWSAWGRPVTPHPPAVTPPVPGDTRYVVPALQPVWIPGFWAWNGFTWVWVPPHWSRWRWNAW